MLNPPAAPASGAGEPNRGAAVELPAPNWNVPEPALPEELAEPKANPPVGVEGCDGCAAPKVKLGVEAAGAAGVVVLEPNPVPLPKPLADPKPPAAPVDGLLLLEPPKPGPLPKPPPAAGVDEALLPPNPEPAPKVNEPEAGVGADAPVVPKPLLPAFALVVVLDDAPNENEGVDGAAALLLPKVLDVEAAPKVLLGVELDEPNEKPPGAGAEPEAGAAGVDGAPKLNGLSPPFTLGVLVAGALDEPKLNGLEDSVGLAALLEPKEKPPDAGAAGAGLAEVEPKLNAGWSAAGAEEPLVEPKPDEAEAAEVEPKLNAGLSFFSSGLAALVVGVDEPNENAGLSATGAAEPKVLPPEGAGDDEAPKLNAGFSAAGLSVEAAGVDDDDEPNEKAGFSVAGLSVDAAGVPKLNAGLSLAAGVEAAGVELPDPKLKGALVSAGLSAAGAGEAEGVPKLNAGLGVSAGLSAAGAAAELPNEKPPVVLDASAGLSAAGTPKLNAGLGVSAGLSEAGVVEPKLKAGLEASAGLEAPPLLLELLKRLLTTGGPLSADLMPKSSLGGGVDVPEAGLEPPKKLGTPPSAGFGVVVSGAEVVVVGGFEKKLLAGGLPAGVVEPVGVSDELLVPEAAPESEKKPVEGGGDLGAELIGAGAVSFLGVVSGLDASATMELFARGDDARGRDCRPLRRLPSELNWALRCWVDCEEAGTLRRELSCGSEGAAGVVLSFGSSFFPSLPNIGIEKFLNDASGILAFSSSSI